MSKQDPDTRMRVLQAAGPIFAAKGFEAATVREICRSADVNLASVNYHFGDKETLYLETVRRAHSLRLEQVPRREELDDADPHCRLRAFIELTLQRVLGVNAETWQSQLMMREVLHPTVACRDMVESYIRPQINELREILKCLTPSSVSRSKLTQMAFSIIGQCLFYRFAGEIAEMLTTEQSRTHYEVDALRDHIYEFSLAAVRGALNSESAPARRRRRANPLSTT